jgi:hypothetical protein
MVQGIGIGLSRRFYQTLVAPLLQHHFPSVPYAAARIGMGSEVLGYDTKMSADHDYGPCVQIFLPETRFETVADEMTALLDRALPETFEGWKIRYATRVRPPSGENRKPGMLGGDHGVELYTLPAWCDRMLGRQFETALSARDWLSYPEQLFLMVTAGGVFRDKVGDLTALRDRLAYFPRDIWLYKLSAQWGRIAEERAYVGRTGDVGDEIGSGVIAGRMVENIMRLAMLTERRYAPYPKWFGTAFSRLACATTLSPMLEAVLAARTWPEREQWLMRACEFLAELQLSEKIPGATAPTVGVLHGRPFRFVDTVAISDRLREAIEDDQIRCLPEFGGVDQYISSNFILAVPTFSQTVSAALLDLGPA